MVAAPSGYPSLVIRPTVSIVDPISLGIKGLILVQGLGFRV